MILIAALIIAVSITAVQPSRLNVAGFVDAAGLEELCALQTEDEAKMASCLGYLAGAYDQILARAATLPNSRQAICLPADFSLRAARQSVLAFLLLSPEQRQSAAALVIERSAMIAFPCGQ